MSYLQTVLIGTLIIALVKGQYDSNVPGGNLDQDSYGNNEVSSDNGYDQQSEIIKRNAAEERFKAVYNRIQQNVAENQELAAELVNEIDAAENSENGKDVGDGIQGDEGNDISYDYSVGDLRGKRSFWRRLGGIGRKVGHIGKNFLGKFLGGGLGGLGALFGR